MIDGFLQALTVVSALGSGLVAGVFFAFSAFVMKGLSRLPPAQGMAAMQAVNVAAVSPLFMAALFGTAAAGAALAVTSLFAWEEPAAVYLLVGSLLYLVGVIVPTAVYHVPRNEALSSVDPAGDDAPSAWARYLVGWTRWNHVRTVAALAAAATLTVGLRVG